MQHSVRPTIL